jgi:ABC-type transporter Mla subunit MlaD
MGFPELLVSLLAVVIGIGAAVGVTVALVRRSGRKRLASTERELRELETRAGSALVHADDRVQSSEDEVGFAVAEFGEAATADFTRALGRSRARLREAFELKQRLEDAFPDTIEERRDWNRRIIELAASAEQALAEQAAAFTSLRSLEQQAPSAVRTVRSRIAELQPGIESSERLLERLRERYSDDALRAVGRNPAQARELVVYAERSLGVAEDRLGSRRAADSTVPLQTAEEAVHRAGQLVAAVEHFEVDALRAESTLAAVIADTESDIVEARRLIPVLRDVSARPGIESAITRAEHALALVTAVAERRDPLGELETLRDANSALDAVTAEARGRQEQLDHARAALGPAIDDAERQVGVARDFLSGYRGPIGPDARTRLAESERLLETFESAPDAVAALAQVRRAASLAAHAVTLGQRDIEAHQQQQYQQYQQQNRQGYGGYGGYGRGGGGGDILGGVVGGLLVGGLMGGFGDGDGFDLGDMFDA